MLKKFLTLNPAAILFAVNAVIALCISWGFHWSTDTTAIVDGVVTAVIALITAAATRPVGLQLIVGSAAGLVTALAPFGLHVTTSQISSASVVLSLILAGVFHLAHVPVAAANKGTTANEIQGVKTAAV